METSLLAPKARSERMAETKTTRHKITTPTTNLFFITTPPFLLEIDCKKLVNTSWFFFSPPFLNDTIIYMNLAHLSNIFQKISEKVQKSLITPIIIRLHRLEGL